MTIQLRQRQFKAILDLRAAYASGARAPILVAPTGFGKTCTAAEIVRSAVNKGNRVWFLAHLREILDDTSQRLTAAGIPHGHIRAGIKPDHDKPVQVVAVQTAVRRSNLPQPDLIIIDECHLAVANSYRQVLAAAGNPLILGLTGTPQRLDGRGLGEVFDRLVLTCSTEELINEQLLAPIKMYAPPSADLSGLRSRCGEYDQGQASEMLSRPQVVGDALSHWRKLCSGRRGVAFCTTVRHAQAVADQWCSAGYRAVAVHGGSDDSERREAVAGLRAGRLDLVACAQLWIAGVDVPEIDAVVWLRPTKSLTAWLQGNGRGLRIADGKTNLLILDHVNNCRRLGHPLEVHEWTLNGAKKRTAEQAPSVKVCPQCFATSVSTAQMCRDCGHVFAPTERRELEVVDGELQELKRVKSNAIKEWGPWLTELTELAGTGHTITCEKFERHHAAAKLVADSWIKLFDFDPRIGTVRTFLNNTLKLVGCRLERTARRERINGKHQWHYEVLANDPSSERKREQGSAQSLQELIALGQQRGYKNPVAWAKHVMAARQTKGHWSRIK